MMKTAKQFLSVLLVLTLVLTCLPLPARAAEVVAGSSPGASLQWTLYSDGLLTVSGSGDMTYCDIEESVPWHNYRDQIRRVEIAEGVTSITNFAFKKCFNLESIEIPDSVTTIADSAFYNCTRLLEVDLPDGLVSIGKYAFYSCENLRRIDFGSSLTEIGNYAFNMCRSLRVVIFPAGVTRIGNWCFQACDSLEIFQFLGNPPEFNSNIFSDRPICYYPAGNSAWDSIVSSGGGVTWKPFSSGDSIYPEEPAPVESAPAAPLAPDSLFVSGSCGMGVTWQLYKNGVLTISGRGDMTDISGWEGYPNMVLTVIITEGVTSVAANAFAGLPALTYVSIPASVKRIGDFAFAWCYELDQVVFAGGAPKMGLRVFDDISLTCYYPAGEWSYVDRLDYGSMYMTWKPYTGGAAEPEEPEPIPPAAELVDGGDLNGHTQWALYANGTLVLSGRDGLPRYTGNMQAPWSKHREQIREVVVEEGITIIGDYDLVDCTNATSLQLPDTLELIWTGGCAMMRSLEEVVLPENLTYIAAAGFSGCKSLEQITIPASVTGIGKIAFSDCTSLEEITFQGSAPSFGENAFGSVEAAVYYPADDPTWTEAVRQNYGGSLTWVPVGQSGVEPAFAGDVNGDGDVNSDDAVYLLYYTLFGDSLYPVSGDCDFNADGSTNSDDAVYLLYYTLFGDALYPLN